MEFFTCWIVIEELKHFRKNFKHVMINLMLYSHVKKESMIKLLKVFNYFSIYHLMIKLFFFHFIEMSLRSPMDYTTVHIINIDVQDNHEEATIGALLISKMAQSLANSTDLDNDIDELLQEFETSINRPLLHTIAFQ